MGQCSFNVRKHQSLEERLGAAQKLIEHFSLPPQCQLVADCMDNNANVAYGVSNERVCIVQQRKIAYLGGKGPFFYNLKDVRQWLEQSYGKRGIRPRHSGAQRASPEERERMTEPQQPIVSLAQILADIAAMNRDQAVLTRQQMAASSSSHHPVSFPC
ncbi:Type II iodothyronine deiodinase [Nibea albiflora]|uniref:Type II iodothyronine deiodinase n=1 Tax=Nibea albiflora TaxID=240163 RepID=A0ACB7FGV8_NIBAL|nr:Type II iodothyronine deiodinase [Nibea albiflora]